MSSANPFRRSTELLDSLRGLHPRLIDLSLDRIRRLLDALGNPEARFPPVIHVAGTNGKGSVGAFVGAIAQASGLRVHTYSSPHLISFHERVVLARPDGTRSPISEDSLVDVLERAAAANAGAPMTFYEITSAAAFLAFAETPADLLVLEVGLGGRLDASNVIGAPATAVITPIAMDHMAELGETLDKIAAEKAGIIKPGAPVVVGPQAGAAMDVIVDRAETLGSEAVIWGQHYDAYPEAGRLVYQDASGLVDLPLPALRGRHQVMNAGIAIAALKTAADHVPSLLNPKLTSGEAFAGGLTQVTWPARMMPLINGPLSRMIEADDELWLDGGHNPSAGAAISQTLADLDDTSSKPIYLVCGMMAGKDARSFLQQFAGLVRGVKAVPVTGGIGDGADPMHIAETARELDMEAETASSVPAALSDLMAWTDAPRRILICGSLALAGSVLAHEQGTSVQSN